MAAKAKKWGGSGIAVACLAGVLAALTLAGCGDDTDDPPPNPDTPPPAAPAPVPRVE